MLDRVAHPRWLRGTFGVALVYHRVEEQAGDSERELLPALDARTFGRQLDWLRRRFEIFPASELFGAALARRRGDPVPLALTFDDDLASHADLALPQLTRRGLRATFFLAGSALDGDGRRPWWELLEAAFREDPGDALRGRSLHEAAAAIEAMPPAERAREAERLERLAGPDRGRPPLDAEGIAGLAESGMEIGFHTLEHHRLPDLSESEISMALSDGRERLEQLVGARLTTIAYPHGAADPLVIEAARRAGYAFGFNTDGVALGPGSNPLDLGRIYPPRSRAALSLYLRGALRAARKAARNPGRSR